MAHHVPNPLEGDEAAQYAIERWGSAHYRTTKDWYRRAGRNPTWGEFAAWIRRTRDPRSEEVARAVETRPGYPVDFPVRTEPLVERMVATRANPSAEWVFPVVHLDTIGRDEHKYAIGVREGRELLGIMELSVTTDPKVAYVDWVEVYEPHRRKGVARALYHRLYQWARDEGLEVEHGMTTEAGTSTLKALRPELEQYRRPNKAAMLAVPPRGML